MGIQSGLNAPKAKAEAIGLYGDTKTYVEGADTEYPQAAAEEAAEEQYEEEAAVEEQYEEEAPAEEQYEEEAAAEEQYEDEE